MERISGSRDREDLVPAESAAPRRSREPKLPEGLEREGGGRTCKGLHDERQKWAKIRLEQRKAGEDRGYRQTEGGIGEPWLDVLRRTGGRRALAEAAESQRWDSGSSRTVSSHLPLHLTQTGANKHACRKWLWGLVVSTDVSGKDLQASPFPILSLG